jgi:predicted lipoprotein
VEVTDARQRRIVQASVWIAPVLLIAILRPWTVRPLEQDKPAVFEPETFAASTWPRLRREASESATDVADLVMPDRSPAKARFVKGIGVVEGIDRQSRVGIIRVQVRGSKPAMVALQIGPVIRGTVLRDAASFIHFSDFTNQFDYAGAANALNDYALRTVITPLPIDVLQGRTIAFTGAAGKSVSREDGAIEITPVHLELVNESVRDVK